MKALRKMDNLDKGFVLAKLFPEELETILKIMEKKYIEFSENEKSIRESWQMQGFFTADYWYGLVQHTADAIEQNRDTLWKRPKRFADHLFDSHYSIFPVYCLIEYAEREDCPRNLKLAVYMLFGSQQLVSINL